MNAERTPCINPRCRRTAPRAEYPGEMICGKCFRTLPQATRNRHRRYWREIRKWDRRIARTADVVKIGRMRNIRGRWSGLLSRHWDAEIKAAFLTPVKPARLDGFLEEIGL